MIVDDFEVIHVDQHDAHRFDVTLATVERLCQVVLEMSAIGERSEMVSPRQFLELQIGRAQFLGCLVHTLLQRAVQFLHALARALKATHEIRKCLGQLRNLAGRDVWRRWRVTLKIVLLEGIHGRGQPIDRSGHPANDCTDKYQRQQEPG